MKYRIKSSKNGQQRREEILSISLSSHIPSQPWAQHIDPSPSHQAQAGVPSRISGDKTDPWQVSGRPGEACSYWEQVRTRQGPHDLSKLSPTIHYSQPHETMESIIKKKLKSRSQTASNCLLIDIS